jgi:hypothetical protein
MGNRQDGALALGSLDDGLHVGEEKPSIIAIGMIGMVGDIAGAERLVVLPVSALA